MKQTLISVLFVFAFAAVGFGAVDGNDKTRPEADVQAKDRTELYSSYRQCSAEAGTRMLHKDEVMACSTIYLQLKLSFVDGVALSDYAALSPKDRASVNRQGYEAYRVWLQRQIAGL